MSKLDFYLHYTIFCINKKGFNLFIILLKIEFFFFSRLSYKVRSTAVFLDVISDNLALLAARKRSAAALLHFIFILKARGAEGRHNWIEF